MDPLVIAQTNALDEKVENARALQSLVDGLPASLKENVDVFKAVRENFLSKNSHVVWKVRGTPAKLAHTRKNSTS